MTPSDAGDRAASDVSRGVGGWTELRRTLVHRSMWGIGDQALYGLSNAAMMFVAARILNPDDFGFFAVLYTSAVIVTAASRSVSSEPFAVLHSDSTREVQDRYGPKAAGLAMAVGVSIGLVATVTGMASGRWLMAMFGFVLPAICLQDYVRYHLISVGRVRASFFNDLVWVVVQFGAVAVLLLVGRLSVITLVLSWGLGATAALVVARWQLGFVPQPMQIASWWHHSKDYSRTYFSEFVAVAASGRSVVYLVAGLAGTSAAGAYRGGEALFGPLTTAVGGLRVVALPEVVRRRKAGIQAIRRAVFAITIGLGSLAAIATGVLYGIGGWIGPLLLGETWSGAQELVIPIGLTRGSIAAAVGPFLGLRALRATRHSVWVRWTGSVGGLVAAGVGVWLAGASGAAWGFSLAMFIMLFMWHVAFIRASRAADPETDRGEADVWQRASSDI